MLAKLWSGPNGVASCKHTLHVCILVISPSFSLNQLLTLRVLLSGSLIS